jgi:2-keto-3-deoxy-L-rhamnonate aldolase RhmA
MLPAVHSGFRGRIRGHAKLLDPFLQLPSTQQTEIHGALGFDFVAVDDEHAPLNRETTDRLLLACRCSGLAEVVRLCGSEDILSVLDCDADGLLVPHEDSAEKAHDAIPLCRMQARGYA